MTQLLLPDGRPYVPPQAKAITGPGVASYASGIPLSMFYESDQDKAKAYLKAYKHGWFYKAESKISRDIASLKVSVSPEDTEGDNQEEVIAPDLYTPWDMLDPIGQFLRLMERPNPHESGRHLRQKTQIRIDMAGTAMWFLDGIDQSSYGTPTAIYGISPSRMWPSQSPAGELIGWVMDRDRSGGGVPFEAREILVFSTASEDDGPFGIGVVEAVFGEMMLTDLMARHTSDLLTTGGRLAGMIWPKNRALDENEYIDAQRAWRSVASDPNAARRLLIFPEPMEYAAGASTPAEIGIPDLARINQEAILTAFPISPYQLGVPAPGGLNSGEVRREDRRDYWEGTIHPRVELFEETVQIGLVSRYEAATGRTYDFDVAEPNLDDPATLINKAGALQALFDLGFDEKEAVAALGLDHIKFNGRPTPAAPAVDPATGQPVDGAATAGPASLSIQVGDGNRRDNTATTETVKSSAAQRQRDDIIKPAERLGRLRMATFLRHQRDRLASRLHAALPSTKALRTHFVKAAPSWWDGEEEDRLLTATMRALYTEVGVGGLHAVANDLGRTVLKGSTQSIIADLLAYGGQRVKDINATTLQALTLELAEGTRRGYSVTQIIEGVPAEGYHGVMGLHLANGAPAFDELRAETIARTEAMLSYNRASLTGYREFGVVEVLAYDGDHDYQCAVRNGAVYPIDEAYAIDDHPNGTLVWAPVVEKSYSEDPPDMEMVTGMKAVLRSLAEPPTVNVEAPVVNVAAPEAPHVTVDTEPFVTAILELKEMLSQPKSRVIERDERGQIVRITDG